MKRAARKFVVVGCLMSFITLGAALASEHEVGRAHPLEYKYSRSVPGSET